MAVSLTVQYRPGFNYLVVVVSVFQSRRCLADLVVLGKDPRRPLLGLRLVVGLYFALALMAQNHQRLQAPVINYWGSPRDLRRLIL